MNTDCIDHGRKGFGLGRTQITRVVTGEHHAEVS